MKNLQNIIDLIMEAIGSVAVYGDPDVMIADVNFDSRKVTVDSLFICIQGATVDGHNYIGSAIEQGANALLIEKDLELLTDNIRELIIKNNIVVLQVASTVQAMQKVVPYFFDYPSKKMFMVGITGTNGKTTVTNMVRKIFTAQNYKVGLIGTINTMIGEDILPSKNTTPDVVDLQKLFMEMIAKQVTHVVMEVSSHALAQERVAGCEFDVAGLTNVTQDHLDFHKTLTEYTRAKSLLFANLKNNSKNHKAYVINGDDQAASLMLEQFNECGYTYGLKNTNDIYPLNYELASKGMKVQLATPQGELNLQLATTGLFNVYNLMAAVGIALVSKISLTASEEALQGFVGVAGRFQLVEAGQKYSVIVDYAHTPDGLENVLQAAREITRGDLIVVFGCGGDRDRTKRSVMASIAEKLADKIIVTSDNPRTEIPENILLDIEQGFSAGFKNYKKIVDRRMAIQTAIKLAKDTDTILIAGKGHENYQILNDRTIHFDDVEVARELIGGITCSN